MLQRSFEKKRAGEAGFTLAELLVVIVILGILAAIVVFAVGGITDKGQTSACKSDTSALEAAEEAYYAAQQAGVYTDEAGLVSGKFLHAQSDLHDIALSNSNQTYTVTRQSGSSCTDVP